MNKQVIDYTVQLSHFVTWTFAIEGNHQHLPAPKELFAALHAFAGAEEAVCTVLDRNLLLINRAMVLTAYSKIIALWSMHRNDFPLRAFVGGSKSVINVMQNDTASILAIACFEVVYTPAVLEQRLHFINVQLRRVAPNLTAVGHVAYAGVVMLFERWAKDCVITHSTLTKYENKHE